MNTTGTLFRISLFGESHGSSVGVTVDGIPAGLPLCESDLLADLARRKPGARGTTPRRETDTPRIVSGVFDKHTTGAPLTVLFDNDNTVSGDYSNLVSHPRPGHSDFVARVKYGGFNDYRGGGHFSGRITLGLVVAGSIAKKMLSRYGVAISAGVTAVGGCDDQGRFADIIEEAMAHGDSVGGIVECTATGVPVGWGEPFFDSVESRMSHLLFSIPGVRGVEFGEGFASAARTGSQHNDPIADAAGHTVTNHAGGVNGGITNGNDIVCRIAVKPTSSISAPQDTYDFSADTVAPLRVRGRHDACIALRVPVIAEAAVAVVLADLMLVALSAGRFSEKR
ncbi:MAG: chorismate synthase [Rikenellaceae bacterium]|nr:chorismate synthase [Rikenellaceae bacterium]